MILLIVRYGRKTWSFARIKEHRLTVSDNVGAEESI
jgi:hypothetical protein